MKNYKFILVFVLSSALTQGAQAASVIPTGEPSLTPPTSASAGPAHTRLALKTQANALNSTAVAPLIKTVISAAHNPQALHYLHEGSAVQGLKQETRMAQHAPAAKSVSEPASEVLLLAGLSALAIAIRRQSPS